MKRDLSPVFRRYLLTELKLTNGEIDGMTANELFEAVLNDEGLSHNCAYKIKCIIKDVYGIDLDKMDPCDTEKWGYQDEEQSKMCPAVRPGDKVHRGLPGRQFQ